MPRDVLFSSPVLSSLHNDLSYPSKDLNKVCLLFASPCKINVLSYEVMVERGKFGVIL